MKCFGIVHLYQSFIPLAKVNFITDVINQLDVLPFIMGRIESKAVWGGLCPVGLIRVGQPC